MKARGGDGGLKIKTAYGAPRSSEETVYGAPRSLTSARKLEIVEGLS